MKTKFAITTVSLIRTNKEKLWVSERMQTQVA